MDTRHNSHWLTACVQVGDIEKERMKPSVIMHWNLSTSCLFDKGMDEEVEWLPESNGPAPVVSCCVNYNS